MRQGCMGFASGATLQSMEPPVASSSRNKIIVTEAPSGRGNLGLFPIEIILRILTNLTYWDLIRCAGVCKFLHGSVDRVLQLLYNAELDAEGYIDVVGVDDSVPVRDRLKLLVRRCHAWRTLYWHQRTSGINLRKPGNLQVASGTFVCQSVDFFDTAPRKKGILYQFSLDTMAEKFFEDDIDDDLCDAYETFDVGQDLLVLGNVCYRRDDGGGFAEPIVARHSLRLRTLSSNGSSPHPDASCEVLLLSFDAPSPENTETLVRIAGTLLGVVVQHATQGFCIAVWDWKTAHMVVNFDGALNRVPLCDFCFLSLHQIMLVCCAPSDVFLEVWSLDPDSSTVNSNRQLLHLSLPDVGVETYKAFTIYHGDFQSDASQDVPFVKRSDGRVYAIGTCSFHVTPTSELCYVFHHDFISSMLSDTTRNLTEVIPWNDWGPRNTRAFLRRISPANGSVCNERLVGRFYTIGSVSCDHRRYAWRAHNESEHNLTGSR
ncbi:hypothetical protein DENSPDRAFT_277414 [Dentipellis sp. KUC8613]|nr:hypothetical protein DENSPDRAFT_277414 [Dentipellis sp. KUC8613]